MSVWPGFGGPADQPAGQVVVVVVEVAAHVAPMPAAALQWRVQLQCVRAARSGLPACLTAWLAHLQAATRR